MSPFFLNLRFYWDKYSRLIREWLIKYKQKMKAKGDKGNETKKRQAIYRATKYLEKNGYVVEKMIIKNK